MAIFGLGTGVPLILLGMLSRQMMMNIRKLFAVGNIGKKILGVIILIVGLLIITGLDKALEALLVTISPEWLTHLSTKF